MAQTLDLGNVIGPAGKDGARGADGATWLNGTAAPTTQGKDGDFYINTSNYDVYRKASGSWTKTGNIKGATGATGPKGDPGATGAKGDPGATGQTGAKGDIGPIGPKGDKGDTGATGAKGDKGDPGAVPTFSINESGHLIATYA